MLCSAYEEADRLLYLKQWKELANFCDGMLILFPGDEKLTLMRAIALAETDPATAAQLAREVAWKAESQALGSP